MAGSPAYLLISPSDYLTFTQEENKVELKATIKVTNQSPEPVAFKIKTTAPKLYKVQPNKGHLKANESLNVAVVGSSRTEIDGNHKFQIIAIQQKLGVDSIPDDVWQSAKSQTVVLLARLSPSLEFSTSRSISMMTSQSVIREQLGDQEEEGLKAECEELKRTVDSLKLKVKAMSDGLNVRKSTHTVKVKSAGFGNTHIVIFFLLGVAISLALKYKGRE